MRQTPRETPLRNLDHASSLAERAYTHVRSAILRGDMPVGSVVAEATVAAELGTSKSPVRAALQTLRSEGLLEPGRRRQLVVVGFSAQHRAEILQVREALERIAVSRACHAMELEGIDHLRVILVRQKRAADAGDDDAFVELDEDFHIGIADGAGLPVVTNTLRRLGGFVRVMRLESGLRPTDLHRFLVEHTAITDAIEAHDEERALSDLTQHLHASAYDFPAAV